MINKLDKLLLQHLIKEKLTEIEKLLLDDAKQLQYKDKLIDDKTENASDYISIPMDETVIGNLTHHKSELMKSKIWLDSEDAGYCEYCNTEISWKRLNAFLESRLCTRCAGNPKTMNN